MIYYYHIDMEFVLGSVFNKNELKQKTKAFYDSFLSDETYSNEVFTEQFGVPYKLIFGSSERSKVVYSMLKKYYQNEYYIKRSFTRQILIKANSITFVELPVHNSRADLINIDKKSCAFEIKTQFDTFLRAKKQLFDYSLAFEYSYIICPLTKLKEAKMAIPDFCGIYVYNEKRNNSKFKKVREASISPNLCGDNMLELFSKEDLNKHFGTSNIKYILSKFSLFKINMRFKEMLKAKYLLKSDSFKAECNLL